MEIRDKIEIASPVFVWTKEWWKKRSWATQGPHMLAMKETVRKVPIGLLPWPQHRQSSFSEVNGNLEAKWQQKN